MHEADVPPIGVSLASVKKAEAARAKALDSSRLLTAPLRLGLVRLAGTNSRGAAGLTQEM